MSNQYITEETIIPIAVSTGYLHDAGNKFEIARQQIEKSAFYLQSIFHLLKLAAPRLEESSDFEIQELGGDLIHFSEIGGGVSESIFKSLSAFYDCEKVLRKEVRAASGEVAAEDLNEKDEDEDAESGFSFGTIEELEGEGIALALSGILNNPNLPVKIYNGLKSGLNDVFNDLPVDLNLELSSYEDSPEYLAKLIEFLEAK